MPTEEQERILKKAPFGATRVLVRTAENKQKYRSMPSFPGPEERDLQDTDVICVNAQGIPVTMAKKPGRKKELKREPKDDRVRASVQEKMRHMSSDPLLLAVHQNPDSIDVLYETMKAIATECASLEFERQEAELDGKNTAMISSLSNRRIAALKMIGDTWLRRYDQISNKGLDLDSPAFRQVFSHLMTTLKEVLKKSGLKADQVGVIFQQLGEVVEDPTWKAEAKSKVNH